MNTYDQTNYPLQDETEIIIGLALEVHKILGPGFLEVVYKDALEYEFNINEYLFYREREYRVKYKDIILKHHYNADFVVFDNVIVEVKAKQGFITDDDMAQTINYLKASGCKVGLILNFAAVKLQIKRVIF